MLSKMAAKKTKNGSIVVNLFNNKLIKTDRINNNNKQMKRIRIRWFTIKSIKG